MKKSRMREMSIEVTVGAFMFMVLLALGIFTIILSRESIFSQNYNYRIVFDQVQGLREGDNVYVRGVNVGKVRSIQVVDSKVQLMAVMEIELQLHDDYTIEILPTSVLGGRYLLIDEGTDSAPLLPPDEVLIGSTPVDLVVEATETIEMVRRALDEGGIIDDLQNTMSNVNYVTRKMRAGEGTVGRLIMEDDFYMELTHITRNLQEVSDRLVRGEGTIGRLLSTNDVIYTDIRDTIAHIRTISERLAEGRGTIGKLLSEEDDVYYDLKATAANLREVSQRLAEGKGMLGALMTDDSNIRADIEQAAASIREITGAIDRGEGTIGKLVRDDSLYNEVTNAVTEARAAIDDIRETSPITTFTSIFFGAF